MLLLSVACKYRNYKFMQPFANINCKFNIYSDLFMNVFPYTYTFMHISKAKLQKNVFFFFFFKDKFSMVSIKG